MKKNISSLSSLRFKSHRKIREIIFLIDIVRWFAFDWTERSSTITLDCIAKINYRTCLWLDLKTSTIPYHFSSITLVWFFEFKVNGGRVWLDFFYCVCSLSWENIRIYVWIITLKNMKEIPEIEVVGSYQCRRVNMTQEKGTSMAIPKSLDELKKEIWPYKWGL